MSVKVSPELRLVAIEITKKCPLACMHCRGDSANIDYREELELPEIKKIIDGISAFSTPIIIITGGEPLSRPDVFEIASYSHSLGLRPVLATCGKMLDRETVRKIKDAGISRISVSIDGPDDVMHDKFRGVSGAFSAAVEGIGKAYENGLEFQINSTITLLNVDEIEKIHDLAVKLGAKAFHPFLLVPMGRGENIKNLCLDPEKYESALKRIANLSLISPIEIKPTCSPHYSRILAEMGAGNPNINKKIITRGCLGGQGFAFISNTGKVQICGFMEEEAGDLRSVDYDFRSIWENSPLFKKIRRKEEYPGKCGECGFWNVCGGCRARAYYMNGSYLGDEPACTYIPKKQTPDRT